MRDFYAPHHADGQLRGEVSPQAAVRWFWPGLSAVILAAAALSVYVCSPETDMLGRAASLLMAVTCLFTPIHQCLPPRWRQPALLSVSLLYCACAISPPFTVLLVANCVVVHACLRVSPSRTWLFLPWVSIMYAWAPQSLLHLSFSYLIAHPTQWTLDLLEDSLLCGIFRRSVICLVEVRTGIVTDYSLDSLMSYLMGLHFLGCHVELSFRHYLNGRSDGQGDRRSLMLDGLETVAMCLVVLVVWQNLWRIVGPIAFAPPAVKELPVLAAVGVFWFLLYYLRRLFVEQGAVGLCRLLGYRIGDNFSPRVLLSKSPVEFWRSWNMLWREFLVNTFYYPTSLYLARRWKWRLPATVASGGLVTFVGAAFFDIFPLCLMHLGTMSALLFQAIARDASASLIWGAVVSVNLYLLAARPRGRSDTRGLTILKVAATLLTVLMVTLYRRNFTISDAFASMVGL